MSFDISKAYNTTWKPLIISSLKEVSANQMFNCICKFLNAKTFQVRVGHEQSLNLTGYLQGSTIFVTLFLVAINSITKKISPFIQSSLYANDSNIFCKRKKLATVQTHLQQASTTLQSEISHLSFLLFRKIPMLCLYKETHAQSININMSERLMVEINYIRYYWDTIGQNMFLESTH